MAMNPFLAQALISGGKAILGHGLSKVEQSLKIQVGESI